MTQTLLVLGAGPLAAPALLWAREAGLAAVAVDSDPRARARRLAHSFHTIPADDLEGHLALLRRLARAGNVAGVHAAAPERVELASALLHALERVPGQRGADRLRGGEARERWLARGIPVAGTEPILGRHRVAGYFRDGAFVPAGVGDVLSQAGGQIEIHAQPSELSPADAREALLLTERAARALGLQRGPVEAELVRGPEGLALASLVPAFADAIGCTRVAPLVLGKSPLQAWFAHLAGAGGPFDELDLAPRCAAGWIALRPARPGLFAGVEGLARTRALPGVVDLWLDEPGREITDPATAPPCGYLWAVAPDRNELDRRLCAARTALEVRVACRQAV